MRTATRAAVSVLTLRSHALIDRIEREPQGDIVGDIAGDRRTWKPSATAWSLSQLVEHLALVANGMLGTARTTQRPRSRMAALKVRALQMVLRSPLRIPVPVSAVVPRADIGWSEARSDLIASNARWSELAERDDLERNSFRHPIVGLLTAVETAAFLVEHFDHHARQVDRIFAALRGRTL